MRVQRRGHQRKHLAMALLWLSSCSSYHLPNAPPDPEFVAAARAEQARVDARVQSEVALRAEWQQQVLAIESEEPPRALSEDELVMVLGYYCGVCHFPQKIDVSSTDGLFYMNDLDELIATGKVIPGDGERSRLVQRVRLGEMPPVQSAEPPMPTATLERIVDYIDSLVPLAEQAAAVIEVEPPWLAEARKRPDVPPVEAECFEYLGDWIRCEHEGNGPDTVDIPGGDLDRCFATCRERSDCVAVTDYTWLKAPGLGCYLYLSSCDAPSTGVWHEEDGGRQYRKTCSPD